MRRTRLSIINIIVVASAIATTAIPVQEPRNVSSAPDSDVGDVRSAAVPPRRHSSAGTTPDELANQRTDNVRHVIAAERKHLDDQAGVARQQEKKEKSMTNAEDPWLVPSLEELRAKCQHFSRLFGSGIGTMDSVIVNGEATDRYSPSATTIRPIVEVTRRPVFIRNKPTYIEKVGGGYYITSSPAGYDLSSTKRPWSSSSSTIYSRYAFNFNEPTSTTTSAPTTTKTTTTTSTSTTTTAPSTRNYENVSNIADVTTTTTSTTNSSPKIQIKYTKFEPVILQKTILTDGRVVYHWHKSLPTASLELPAATLTRMNLAPVAPVVAPIVQPTALIPPVVATLPLTQRHLDHEETATPTTTTTTTTTTEKSSSWLFVPFSNLFGGGSSNHEEETTTAEATTSPSTTTTSTTTTTTQQPSTEATQLKLVVPVHYDDIDSTLSAQNHIVGFYKKTGSEEMAANSAPSSSTNSLQLIKTLSLPQNLPRYGGLSSLGYTGNGYGLTFNGGLPYAAAYSPEYINYRTYGGDDGKKFDAVAS